MDVASLAPIWTALGEGTKKEKRTILQAALDDFALSPDAATSAKLLVDKKLCDTIVNLVMHSGDSDRLDEGLHPFRSVYVSVAKSSEAQSYLHLYDTLATEGTLKLEDLHLFQHVLKTNWPNNFLQLDTSIKLFYNLIAVLFSKSHPLCLSFSTFLRTWDRVQVTMSEYFSGDPAKPSQFLRSLQLKISVNWETLSTLNHQDALLHPAPNLLELIRLVRERSWVPPSLPGFSPPVVSPLPGKTPTAETLPPTAAILPQFDANKKRQSVTNPHRHPEIIKYMNGRNFRFRDLLKTCSVPTTKDGKPICLAYHLRGNCFDDCQRKNTHTTLDKEDVSSLLGFTKTNVVDAKFGE